MPLLESDPGVFFCFCVLVLVCYGFSILQTNKATLAYLQGTKRSEALEPHVLVLVCEVDEKSIHFFLKLSLGVHLFRVDQKQKF
jgi:hypothetical protein